MRTLPRLALLLGAGGLLSLVVLAPSQARGDDPAPPATSAEALVRGQYYEGLPYDRALELPPDSVELLAALLADPDEAAHHANIVMALGIAGHAGSFEVLVRFAAAEPQGPVDGATYQARLALPFAFGHLARVDDRALAWLHASVARPVPPTWWTRRSSGERLSGLLWRAAVRGLAISGRTEAATALRAAAAGAPRPAAGDTDAARRSRHLASALQLHVRVLDEGPTAVFGDPHAAGGP